MLFDNVLWGLILEMVFKTFSKGPCDSKGEKATLCDIIITKNSQVLSFIEMVNVELGTRDFHNFIITTSRCHTPKCNEITIIYKSNKNISDGYILQQPLHICEVLVDTAHANFVNTYIIEICLIL